MIAELAVRDLGVFADARVVLDDGLTALTGETGAGKSLVVGAIQLLLGARADASVVRSGAEEAVVDGRFVTADGEELVLSRVIPAAGTQIRAIPPLAEMSSKAKPSLKMSRKSRVMRRGKACRLRIPSSLPIPGSILTNWPLCASSFMMPVRLVH